MDFQKSRIKGLFTNIYEGLKRLCDNRLLKIFAQIIFVGLILVSIFQYILINWERLKTYHWEVNYTYLSLSFLILLGHRFWGATGWYMAVRILSLSQKKPRFIQMLKVYSISNLAAYIPGTYWSLLGRVYLSRDVGISTKKASASIILETFMVVFSGIIMTLFIVPTIMSDHVWAVSLGTVLIVILVLIGINKRFILCLTSIYCRISKKEIPEYDPNSLDLLLLLIVFIMVWVMLGASLFFLTKAIDPSHSTNIFYMIGSFSAAWLIGFFVPIAPSGLGVRETILIYFLHLASVPDPLPAVLAILFRIIIALQDLFWALLSKLLR